MVTANPAKPRIRRVAVFLIIHKEMTGVLVIGVAQLLDGTTLLELLSIFAQAEGKLPRALCSVG